MTTSTPDDTFGFSWPKSKLGYEFGKPAKQKPAQVITGWMDYPIKQIGQQNIEYEPRQYTMLHREFANLPRDADSILAFVKRYGFLGVSGSTSGQVKQETLAEIIDQRDQIRRAILCVDEIAKFKRRVEEEERRMSEAGEKLPLERGSDILTRSAIQFFNEWQAAHPTHLVLVLRETRTPRGRVVPVINVRPRTLIASLWLAVAEEICSGQKFRNCIKCAKVFRVGEGGARSDKTTCSDSCRQTVSRQRKAEDALPKGRKVGAMLKGKRK
jgi:hypothetical protein